MQVLREWETMRSVLSSLMRLERVGLDDDRTIALDTATVLSPKLTRYLAAIALLTLGEDKVIAEGVRKLTPKVTAISEGVAAGSRSSGSSNAICRKRRRSSVRSPTSTLAT